ncbi:MAG: TlpA family protein disulfide reductase [Planctomycetaceae bacterium]|nr:TlpA family protein disulfide reductase [Planctomycetaceae bacterium]
MGCSRRCLQAIGSWLLLLSAATAQSTDTPAFPSDPAQWINAAPLSLEALRGKGAFLWFFEEDCPRCRGKWPEMQATAKKFEGQPVVFIAVNSGNNRAAVQTYVREVGLTWPVIVDPDRSFEKQHGVDNISLQNIYQARYITADGKARNGSWSEIEGTINQALTGARWKVDPKQIPPALRDAWLAIEFNNYAGAGMTVKKSLSASKYDVKEGANALLSVVQKEIDADAASFQQAVDAQQAWKACEIADQMAVTYRGFDLPLELVKSRKQLSADPQVKAAQVALKGLEAARRQLASNNDAARKNGTATLEKIGQDFPGTRLAEQAQNILQGGGK